MKYRITKWVLDRVRALFPKSIATASVESTYYLAKDVPPSVKINDVFVNLNFGSLSPFEGGQMLYVVDKSVVHIWFYEKQSYPEITGFLFPEGYLLAQSLRTESNDVLLWTEYSGYVEVVVVKARGEFVSQFVSKKHGHQDEDSLISMLTREHGLLAPQVRRTTCNERLGLIQCGLYNVSVLKLLGFWASTVNWKTTILRAFRIFLVSLTIFLLCGSAIQVASSFYLNWRIDVTKHEVDILNQNLQEVMQDRKIALERNKIWSIFAERELSGISEEDLYFKVVPILKQENSLVERWRANTNEVIVTLLADDITHLLQLLNDQLPECNVSVKGAVRVDKKSKREKATLLIKQLPSGESIQ